MDSHHSRDSRPPPTATSEPQPNRSVFEAESPSRRRHDESWVEIASQPSSSSLSSIADEEIITTGLRVRGLSNPLRRRHRPSRQAPSQHSTMPQSYIVSHAAARGGNSSQEDYDETESDEDASPSTRRPAPTMPPSSSHIHLGSRQQAAVPNESSGYDDDDDDSGDESATALGLPSNTVFRPQPNAFSHPPSHLTHRHSTPGAYAGGGNNSGGPHPRGSAPRSRRSSYSRGSSSRNPPHFLHPSYREDNDAALRASLTTLLSCAAAARGLPNRRCDGDIDSATMGGRPSSNAAAMQPMDLRLVPEAELMAENPRSQQTQSSSSANTSPDPKHVGTAVPAQHQAAATTATDRRGAAAPAKFARSPSSTSSGAARTEKSKRAAAGSPPSAGGQKAPRATKKKRVEGSAGEATFISPTLLTWVVSAGVVVLVSVVGFGAGYVIGREVGRQEGASAAGGFMSSSGAGAGGAGSTASSANATGSCGRDIIGQSSAGGTLRRFRWGSMGRSVVA